MEITLRVAHGGIYRIERKVEPPTPPPKKPKSKPFGTESGFITFLIKERAR